MGAIRLGFLIVIYLVSMGVARVQAQDWLYSVRTDDNLWKICQTYVAKPLCWLELGRYNALSNTDLIKPGRILKIPYAWLKYPPQPATISDSRGEVNYIPAADSAKSSWEKLNQLSSYPAMVAAGIALQPLPEDHKIHMGDRIITGQGNVSIFFADGSQMLIRAGSDITFDRISIKDGKGFVDTLLVLKRGATDYNIKGKKGLSRYRVDTPAGVAAVRGTEFRVNLQAAEKAVMRSEVLQGDVIVSDTRGQSSQQVPGGYGVRSEQGQPIPPPLQLLPAVEWENSNQDIFAIPFEISWKPLTGAQYYLVDLYDSKGLIASWKTEKNSWENTELGNGGYRLLVRGVDQLGLQGLDAEQLLKVENPLPAPELSAGSIKRAGKAFVEVSWPRVVSASGYRIEVATDPEFKQILLTDSTVDTVYGFSNRAGGYVRVTAISLSGVAGDSSDAVWLVPQPYNWQPWAGLAAVVLGIILL